VISKSEEKQYERMATLNRECLAFYQYFKGSLLKGSMPDIDFYIL
jgi:hypothetical protein